MEQQAEDRQTDSQEVEVVTLTRDQKRQLKSLEVQIEEALASFLVLGKALREIRDSRLYRETHATFELYCRDRWKLSKTHVNRQIAAAEAVETLGPVEVRPVRETQARPLVGLDPQTQAAAWDRAQTLAKGAGKTEPTQAMVEQAVAIETNTLRPEPAVRRYVLVDDLINDFSQWAEAKHFAPGFIRSTVAWFRTIGSTRE